MATSPAASQASSGSMTSAGTVLSNPSLNFTAGSSSTSSSGPFNFAPLVTVRLGGENYLYWRAQVTQVLRSQRLLGFLDGTFPCPPGEVDNPKFADDPKVPRRLYNPEFTAWHQQDAATLSAIMATSTEAVHGMIIFVTIAQDAWSTLAASFSSESQSKYMQLRHQLQDTKKLELTATAYYNKIKTLSDTLTAIGQPLRPAEFNSYILEGLDEDYEALAQIVSARTTPMPPRDLFALLLSTEQCVEARKAVLQGGHNFHANAAGYSKGSGKQAYHHDYRGEHGTDPSNQARLGYYTKPAGHPFNTGGGGGSNNTNRAGGGGGFNPGGYRQRQGDDRGDRSMGGRGMQGGNRPICQICDKVGHIASQCFKRFKTDYLGVNNDGRYMDRQVNAATTSYAHGHTTAYSVDLGWYMDTGATDHLTNRLDKLTVKDNYRGSDQVHAANGTGPGHEGHSS